MLKYYTKNGQKKTAKINASAPTDTTKATQPRCQLVH